MKLTLILVHGIGDNKKDWAKDIIPRIKTRLGVKLKVLLGDKAPADIDQVAVIGPTYWKDVFKDREKHLADVLDGFPKPTKGGGSLWVKIVKLFIWIWKGFKKIQDGIITGYVGDIIGYQHEDAQKAVYAKITDALNEALHKTGDGSGKIPVTFIAHSLGTVITSDYIFEQGRDKLIGNPKILKDRFKLSNIFTIGSPLAIYSLRFGGPETFTKPVNVEDRNGRWVNIFDEDDPVGMPLKTLNEAYQKAVLKDATVEAGVYAVSHMGYFKKRSKVFDIICQKLAIDWIALNHLKPEEEIQKLYEQYDKTLGITK